jgi:flagellar basal body-associated protein FliL
MEMAEETEEVIKDNPAEVPEEIVAKPRFKISKPNPLLYFVVGPFILIFIIYIVLTKMLISSDLEHEAKLQKVMTLEKDKVSSEVMSLETAEDAGTPKDEAGFLDIHNYFEFPATFAVNIPDTNKNLTFNLAVSSFQSGVTAEWFFESFTAFVPAIRSDILYFMGAHSLEDLKSADFQALLLNELKDVINGKLEALGADPKISQVLFLSFVIT